MALTPTGTGTVFSKTKKDRTTVWCAEVVVGYKTNGKPQKTRRTYKTQAEAKRGLNALVAERERGNLHVINRETVEEFALRWIRDVKSSQVRPSTLSDYEFRLRRYVFPYLGHYQLRDIRGRDIESWMSMLLKEGKSTATVAGARRILFGLFKHAYRQEIINRNPVEQTDAPKRQSVEVTQVKEPWTAQEVIKAFECASLENRSTHKDISLLLTLGIYLGLRRGEMLGLKWDDIDFEANTITVRRTLKELKKFTNTGKIVVELSTDDPKTKSSARTLPITSDVRQALIEQKFTQEILRHNASDQWKDEGWLFTTETGTVVYPSNVAHRYRTFLKKNNLRHIRIHDLRHTTAVLALTSGIPLETVSQGLGHSRIDITKDVYAKHVPKLNEDFGIGLAAYIMAQKADSKIQEESQGVPTYFLESVPETNSRNSRQLHSNTDQRGESA